jgi:hypothetical protein
LRVVCTHAGHTEGLTLEMTPQTRGALDHLVPLAVRRRALAAVALRREALPFEALCAHSYLVNDFKRASNKYTKANTNFKANHVDSTLASSPSSRSGHSRRA